MRRELFPTPIWSWPVPNHQDFSQTAREWTLEKSDGSERWQSRTDLHTLDEFAPLCEFILKRARKPIKDLAADIERHGELVITGMWINQTTDHRIEHETHTHPNNYLSGIYYVDAPATMGHTVFVDPRSGASAIVPRPAKHNNLNAMQQVLRAGEGSIVFFPAYLPHRVSRGTESAQRITISFNVSFSDGETMARPLWGV